MLQGKFVCTKVTKKGVEMALENLPDLKVFDFDFQFQSLAMLLRRASRENRKPPSCLSNLTSLHNTGLSFVPIRCQKVDIELVAANCSSVNKVFFDPDFFKEKQMKDAIFLEFPDRDFIKSEKSLQPPFLVNAMPKY